ncbi:MAG: PSD1 and planctomycete cytochrome C domain-containing protein [Pirellula sp.]|nr:PSD1 and planctomycete cytochrome C domain-containing protein [Pirellula sp.]
MAGRRARIFFRSRIVALSLILTCCSAEVSYSDPPKSSQLSEELDFFETKIRPVLAKHCYECHSESSSELQGGLRVDTREGLRIGGDSGPAVVPGNAAQSLLLSAIRFQGLEMPPEAKLEDAAIANIQRWIETGATDPRDGAATLPASALNLQKSKGFWSFQPIQVPALPRVRNRSWPTSPIDYFILAKLESSGLEPAPPADKSELVRRVYFDLHGLPPTPDQVRSFVMDESPDANERLIDELLASPRYGERWGQHWLDVLRFAETEGFEYDRTIQGAWRFRDYVIRSFNDGKPIDAFITEQLAGDEMDFNQPKGMVAAGFHRLGAVRRNAGNQEVAGSRNEVLTERTDIIGSAIMGLTIGCARCHNHKFDPISQTDYYRLQAFFATSHDVDIPMVPESEKVAWEKQTTAVQTQIDNLKSQLATQSAIEQTLTRKKMDKLEKELPPSLPSISTVQNQLGKETPIHVLRRGEFALPGKRVAEGIPLVFSQFDEPAEIDRAKPRTALAKWLTSPRHPLTSRVFVNRIWLNHFGQGIVATPNDFGLNGKLPSHPELMDYLADFFMRNGWQAKSLHRLILLSSTYRQSSQPRSRDVGHSFDPDNALLWHYPLRRLSAEEIRDSMLVVSGQINFANGGPSVILPVDKQLVAQLYKPSQWEVTPEIGERMRRSVYLFAKRNLRLPFMEVFDQPTSQTSCFRRQQSTHAPQALELLNGPMANQMAEALAERLRHEAGSDVTRQIDFAFEWILGRLPTESERRFAKSFLENGSTREFSLALFNLNAFLYVR